MHKEDKEKSKRGGFSFLQTLLTLSIAVVVACIYHYGSQIWNAVATLG